MTVLGVIVTAIALVVGFATHYLSKKDDTAIEQMAEKIVESQSGIKIDFSDCSKTDCKKDEPSEK